MAPQKHEIKLEIDTHEGTSVRYQESRPVFREVNIYLTSGNSGNGFIFSFVVPLLAMVGIGFLGWYLPQAIQQQSVIQRTK